MTKPSSICIKRAGLVALAILLFGAGSAQADRMMIFIPRGVDATTTTTANGGSTTTVAGGSTTTVAGGSTTTVAGGSTTTVAGGSTTTVSGGSTTTVAGGSTTTSITVPGGSVCETTIDFEGAEEGEIVSKTETASGLGPIGVDGDNPRLGGDNASVIYDSTCSGGCSGGDTDLQQESQGNVLIIAESLSDEDGDDRVDDPDDQKNTAVVQSFDFSEIGPVTVRGITVLDVDDGEKVPTVELFDDQDKSLAKIELPTTGDGGLAVVEWEAVENVTRMTVTLHASGAIDDVQIEIPNCSTSTTTEGGSTTTVGGSTTTTVGGSTTTTLGGGSTTTTVGGSTTTTVGGSTTTTLGGGSTTTTVGGSTTTTVGGSTTTTVGGGSTTTTPGGSTTTTPGGSTTTTVGVVTPHVCGDADDSGSVTAADALLTLKASVGLSHVCALGVCDVDANAAITVADALRVLQYAVGVDIVLVCD